MNVRKIKNTSENEIGVQVDERTTIYLKPGVAIKDIQVKNMNAIKDHVNVEYDLSEVTPIKEGRQQING